MPNLKEVRNRIASVQSTQQITSAMKMVAASRLRKAQNAILQMRPYALKLGEILGNLSSSLRTGSGISPFTEQREIRNTLIIAVSSNRGLCGAFNSNIIKAVNRIIESDFKENKENGTLHLLTIGKKVSDYFTKKKFNVAERRDDIWDNLSFDTASEISVKLMEWFVTGKYDRIEIVYNQFRNAAVQTVTREHFLPVKANEAAQSEEEAFGHDYIFEPGREEIIRDLIPKSLKIQFYKVLLDSNAAEQGARMTAMHQATDNAQELLRELRISYNKARQATITKELLEIVSGAEALKG